MGFNKIESYMEKLYLDRTNNNVFIDVPLKKLKFLIDGIQFMYVLSELFENGEFSGNYDKFYDYLKKVLGVIKFSIEAVIFKTVTKDDANNEKRLENYSKNLQDDVQVRTNPGLFYKMILLEVLNELEIKILIQLDHWSMISYSSENTIDGNFFTIISKDSIFNTIDLKAGYLSLSYSKGIFKNLENITDNTMFSIFYLQNLLYYLNLQHDSWIYFCILNGYKEKFERNGNFIGKRSFENLLKSMKTYEGNNVRNNFWNIRKKYSQNELYIIDELIEKIKLQRHQRTNFINENLNEFDRIIFRAVKKKMIVFPCLIEDFSQPSVFKSNIIEGLYREIYSEIFLEGILIKEFYRFKEQINQNIYKVKKLDHKPYLEFFEKNFNTSNEMSLFLCCICFWKEENKNEIFFQDCFNALIINFLIISLKYKKNYKDFTIFEQDNEDISNLITEYNNILIADFNNVNFRKVVHIINKFQALYQTFGLFACAFKLNLKFLSPRNFLNGCFVTKYVLDTNVQNQINSFTKKFNTVLLHMKDKINNITELIEEDDLDSQIRNLNLDNKV
ncbi:unnamed protein product [Brachionus calyciflorus]|uniref:Uncharacterized protein n=1 Tax=Brachionus calyciflorus TaxID=104777 RepID=A0A814L6S3_9BILA|nr:unnamed protein product [Brachionus calyciflorus]